MTKKKRESGSIAINSQQLSKMNSIIKTIKDHKEKGRVLSDIFLELPDKNDYPDYYEIIEQPIALDMIETKIAEQQYKSLSALYDDLKLMFHNAMTYNKKSSIVYKDAQALLNVLEKNMQSDEGSTSNGDIKKWTVAEFKDVWKKISTYTDDDDRLVAELFSQLPDADEYPDYYEEAKIKKKINNKEYADLSSFEADFSLMFANAKQYNAEGSDVYADAVTLETVFHQLIGKSAGGGDVTIMDVIEYKGQSYRSGDYVYIKNYSSPDKPTVVQIMDVWSDNSNYVITGCWFLRPEQTVHKATQKFMENEVFKTNHVEHYKCEDVVGRAIVLFVKDYIRGRPKGFDMKDVYVCESRYNETAKSYAKIKSWASCMPEKAKNVDVDLVLYDTPLVPVKVSSTLVQHETQPSAPSSSSKKRKFSLEEETESFAQARKTPAPTESEGNKKPRPSSSNPPTIPYQKTPVSAAKMPMALGNFPGLASAMKTSATPQVSSWTAPTVPGAVQAIPNAEPLSTETVNHFDSTMDGRVKWFPAPPVSVIPTQPPLVHSLNYLLKRKELAEKASTRVPPPTLLKGDDMVVDKKEQEHVVESVFKVDTTKYPPPKVNESPTSDIEREWKHVTEFLSALTQSWLQ